MRYWLLSLQVTIIESGKTGWLGIGIVHEDYDVDEMPGFEDGSVGYHTDDGKIFQNDYDPDTETEGIFNNYSTRACWI